MKCNNAWLVRPFPNQNNRIEEFKSQNIVAIGWPHLGDLTGFSRQQLKDRLSMPPYNYSGLKLGNTYATFDIFLNKISVNDLILVPNGEDIYFGKITSDYFLETSVDNDEFGYPHQRTVQWLANCSRNDLSKSLRSSLKVHRTTADLSAHKNEIAILSNGDIPQLPKTIEVKYPIRYDFELNYEIPTDLTKEEATRIAKHFENLYFDSDN